MKKEYIEYIEVYSEFYFNLVKILFDKYNKSFDLTDNYGFIFF